MQEKDIILFYSEKGITYHGSINRAVFLDKMNKLISWYPTCNENAKLRTSTSSSTSSLGRLLLTGGLSSL